MVGVEVVGGGGAETRRYKLAEREEEGNGKECFTTEEGEIKRGGGGD